MYQMPNIWHIWHTKHKNRSSSDVLNMLKLWNMLQYALIFESVWMKMPFLFIIFLFIFLFPLSSLYLLIFSLLSPSLSISSFSVHPAQDLSLPHLAVNLHSPHRRPPQPLPQTFRSLNRFMGVIFGMGFDVWVLGHW